MSRSITQPPASGEAGTAALVTLDGRYHVLERIAAGGMGEVFRAHDAVLAREVAIKVLHRSLAGDPGFVERFRTEARAAATLNHPNIVAVYDWGAVDGIYYMVMEFVRGRGVRDLLNANGRLAPSQAADIVRQTLVALEHAHEQGIVHRDLKPENILITSDGVVKLTDLGLARAYADATATRTGQVTGTVQYLSPEQIRGEPADPRSDLYSVGIVAFELLTGRLPFTGETPMSIAYKHLSDRVPPPSSFAPGIPDELDGFVTSATDRDRELRPESAREMRRDLEALMPTLAPSRSLAAVVGDLPETAPDDADGGGIAATTTATIARVEATRRRRLRRGLGWITAIVALAAVTWGVWTYALPRSASVPDLRGRPLDAAQATLEDLGFVVRLDEGGYDRRVAEGAVLEVSPRPGTELERGATITLTPSLGPPLVAVPDVTGKTLQAAERALHRSRLGIEVARREYHDRIPEGAVISQTPLGGQLQEGEVVRVVVSRGHAPVRVPDVAGDRADAAVTALERLGFVVTVREEFSAKVAKGRAIEVVPASGTTQDYGSALTLTVSLGPERFPAPDFVGLSVGAARTLASRHGLAVALQTVPGTNGDEVVSQLPEAGTTVRYGQTITLFLV
jgi:serine/threonine-protein kinase